ncbi:MAG: hypothetical protein NEHIOOID_00987 [Holosporales bacterium]
MNYSTFNFYAMLSISILWAAESDKNTIFKSVPALAVQPHVLTPEHILQGKNNYPKAWDDYSIKDMFDMLDGERIDLNFLRQWIYAMYACFDVFDKNKTKFKAINYVKTIYALAKYTKGYKNSEIDPLIDAFLAVWSQKAPIQHFNAQNIANSLWAFAKLEKSSVPDVLLQAITESNIADFSPQNIANCIWAFAKLGVQAPSALLQAITVDNVRDFNAQGIANCLWAFAKFGRQVPAALFQAITADNIGEFKSQGIANCLWAFAKLGQKAPDVLLQAITEGNIHEFNAQEIGNSLWAFAKLGQKAPDILLQAITENNIGAFNAQEITNSLWAFATLSLDAPNALFFGITARIHEFNPQALATCLWACATLGKPAPVALLQAITGRNIHEFNPQDIVNSLWAFAKFGKKAPAALLQAFTEKNVHAFKAQGIANSLWAFAKLSQAAPAVLLQAITQRNIHEFNAQDIANSLWAFAVMNYENMTIINLLYERVFHLAPNLENMHQIYLASQRYDLGFDVDLALYRQKPQRISQSECLIFDALRDEYPTLNPQYFIDCIASYADFYIEINNQKFVIFIDGATHYDRDERLRASDAFLDRLLEKYGYKVCRVKLENIERDIQAVKRYILLALHFENP